MHQTSARVASVWKGVLLELCICFFRQPLRKTNWRGFPAKVCCVPRCYQAHCSSVYVWQLLPAYGGWPFLPRASTSALRAPCEKQRARRPAILPQSQPRTEPPCSGCWRCQWRESFSPTPHGEQACPSAGGRQIQDAVDLTQLSDFERVRLVHAHV